MNTQSILDPRLYGVISVTGLYGVGKTTFSTTAERPDLTAIIDFDLKFKAEAERLGFWYRSPDHTDDMLSVDFPKMVTWFKQAASDIPAGTTVVVIDNAAPLEGLLGYIVSQAPEKYGVNPSNARSGSYGGVNPGISRLWKNITLHLQKRGVKVIFVVSHVGSPWINGQPVPNRYRGKGNKALQEMSNLSVVLVRDKSYIPAGIVLKEQFAQRTFGDDGWNVRRVLPLRFPRATWKDILAYFNTPADFDNPKAGEVPTQGELETYGELFSNQQLEFIKAVASGTFVEDGEAPQFVPTEPEPQPVQPEPKPTTKENNGHGKGKVANTPMTTYWLKVNELGLTNGKDILDNNDGDPVKALAAVEGMNQLAPEA
jgi:hypothetical protein